MEMPATLRVQPTKDQWANHRIREEDEAGISPFFNRRNLRSWANFALFH